ncbi:hypothetical protein ACU686_35360 [Yinghuangia aomiensis]
MFEPLANALNWVGVGAGLPGDRVVVQGPGHQGLLCAAAALACGASQVIVTGTGADELRLKTALALGAHHVIDVDAEDVVARVGGLDRRQHGERRHGPDAGARGVPHGARPDRAVGGPGGVGRAQVLHAGRRRPGRPDLAEEHVGPRLRGLDLGRRWSRRCVCSPTAPRSPARWPGHMSAWTTSSTASRSSSGVPRARTRCT